MSLCKDNFVADKYFSYLNNFIRFCHIIFGLILGYLLTRF